MNERDKGMDLYARFEHLINPFFEANSDAEWIAIGLSSELVLAHGSDSQLPSEADFRLWQELVGEPIEVFGPTVVIEEAA